MPGNDGTRGRWRWRGRARQSEREGDETKENKRGSGVRLTGGGEEIEVSMWPVARLGGAPSVPVGCILYSTIR